MRTLAFLCCFSFVLSSTSTTYGVQPTELERSFWLNASLGPPKLGYWGEEFPPPKAPAKKEIENAVRALLRQASPNRLYLIHHGELPITETKRIFRDWRKSCPKEVDIIPTLLLRMYNKDATPVFTGQELAELVSFFKVEIHPDKAALYDVLPGRDQGDSLVFLAGQYPQGLLHVGLQPGEALDKRFIGGVQDTWSGFCHGLTNDDWQNPGFGRDTLRAWIDSGNRRMKPVAYDLIVVAWDYSNTKRGEYPGYDDANKNLPLPAGRNRLAAREILGRAKPESFAGFSADLLIIELNSETSSHDGNESFYTVLKKGGDYNGFYGRPWRELCEIFRGMASGRLP